VTVSQADQQKQYELDLKIRDQISDLHDTVNDIRTVRVQFRGLENRLGDDAKYKMILTSAQTLDKKMTPIEEQLLQVKAKSTEANLNFPVLIDERLHSLLGSVDNPDAAPTEQQYAAFQELSQQASTLIAQWRQLRSGDLVALNDMMLKESVPAIYIAPRSEEEGAKAGGQ
jgi:hypothetical protein